MCPIELLKAILAVEGEGEAASRYGGEILVVLELPGSISPYLKDNGDFERGFRQQLTTATGGDEWIGTNISSCFSISLSTHNASISFFLFG